MAYLVIPFVQPAVLAQSLVDAFEETFDRAVVSVSFSPVRKNRYGKSYKAAFVHIVWTSARLTQAMTEACKHGSYTFTVDAKAGVDCTFELRSPSGPRPKKAKPKARLPAPHPTAPAIPSPAPGPFTRAILGAVGEPAVAGKPVKILGLSLDEWAKCTK